MLAVVGIAYFLGMPVIIGMMMDGYQFSAAQAGYLSSSELGGTALASILVSFMVNRVNRRYLVLGGLLVAIVANLLTTVVDQYGYLLTLRLVAGVGSGTVYATGIALLAATTHSTRNFSILIFVQVSLGTLELYFLPLLVQALGVNAIFTLFAAVYCLSILLLPAIATQAADGCDQGLGDRATANLSSPLNVAGGFGLLAIFAFYLTIGSFWAYVERYGVSINIAERQISEILARGNVLSLLGCLIAYCLSLRFRALWPLVIGLALVSLSSLLLGSNAKPHVYSFAISLFLICWNLVDVTQLGFLCELDSSGRTVALAPAFQAAGTTLGPAAASGLLVAGYPLADVVTLNAVPAFFACLCILVALLAVKKAIP